MTDIVYGLEDPRDRLYHYVGITDDVYARFVQHVTGSGGNIEKNGWIWECRQANIMIVMRELERIEEPGNGLDRERFWISYYLHIGHPLHNLAIAKGILKQKEGFERMYERSEKKRLLQVQEEKIILQAQEENELQQVVTAWNDGYRSIGRVMEATGFGQNKSRRLIAMARHRGLLDTHTHIQTLEPLEVG